MNEIFRRVILLIGALAATIAFCMNSGPMVRVHVEQTVAPNQVDMIQRPADAEWQRALDRAAAADASAALEFFSPDEPPFPEFLRALGKMPYAYGFVELSTTQGPVILSVRRLDSNWVVQTAPTSVAYPHRWLSPWILGTALVAYLLLPWPRRLGQGVWQYGLLSAGLVPDLFAALPLVIICFGAPLLIVGANSPGGPGEVFDLREGWAFLTLVMWSLAAIAALIFWFTAWYTAYAVALRPAGVWVRTVRGEREYRFDEIVAVRRSQVGLPDWARRMMWLAPLVNWRVLPTLIVAETADTRALDLTLQDGATFRLPVGALPGIEQLVYELENRACGRSIPATESLPSLAEVSPRWAAAGWIEVARRSLLLIGIALGAWVYLHTAAELIVIRPATFESERARLADYFFINNLQSLEDYLARIAGEDPSRVMAVAGSEWERLFQDLDHAVAGRDVGDLWQRGRVDESVCFARPEAPEPLPQAAAGIERSLGPRYLRLEQGAGRRYLAIAHLDGLEAAYRASYSGSLPPLGLLHPMRRWTWMFLAPALLAYVAIPWPRRLRNMVAASMPGVVVEDALSCLFATATVTWLVVLAIPYLQDAPESPLEDSLLFFGIAGLGIPLTLSFAVDATRRAALGVLVAADGLVSRSLRRIQKLAYQEISAVEKVQLGPPAWIAVSVVLAGLLIWPVLPLGALLLRSRSQGIAIQSRSGEVLRVSKSLRRFDLLEQAMSHARANRVKVDPVAVCPQLPRA